MKYEVFIDEIEEDLFEVYTLDDSIMEFYVYTGNIMKFHGYNLEQFDVLIVNRKGIIEAIYKGENDGWEEFKVYFIEEDGIYSKLVYDDLHLVDDDIEMCEVEDIRRGEIKSYKKLHRNSNNDDNPRRLGWFKSN